MVGLKCTNTETEMANSALAYRPHLPSLMTLCSTNYGLLVRLLAGNEQAGEYRQFFISEQLCYQLTINEVTRYTSLITIKQSSLLHSEYGELVQPSMQIRLYHDARMAEVLSSQQVRYIKPRYDYPNDNMHLPDEKRQINLFLKEWLQLCLAQGQVQVAIK